MAIDKETRAELIDRLRAIRVHAESIDFNLGYIIGNDKRITMMKEATKEIEELST